MVSVGGPHFDIGAVVKAEPPAPLVGVELAVVASRELIPAPQLRVVVLASRANDDRQDTRGADEMVAVLDR